MRKTEREREFVCQIGLVVTTGARGELDGGGEKTLHLSQPRAYRLTVAAVAPASAGCGRGNMALSMTPASKTKTKLPRAW